MDWRARFPGISESDWHDWRWQHRNALRSAEDLGAIVALGDDERRGLAHADGRTRVAVTPYYASLMDPAHASCPIRMQAIPLRRRRTSGARGPARSDRRGGAPARARDRPQVP